MMSKLRQLKKSYSFSVSRNFFPKIFSISEDAKAFTFAWVKAVVAHGGSTSQMKGSIEAGTDSALRDTKNSWT